MPPRRRTISLADLFSLILGGRTRVVRSPVARHRRSQTPRIRPGNVRRRRSPTPRRRSQTPRIRPGNVRPRRRSQTPRIRPGNVRRRRSVSPPSSPRAPSVAACSAAANEWTIASAQQARTLCNCQICLESYQAGEKLRTLPCLHSFHSRCIQRWLHTNNTCPVCRQRV